MLAEYLCYSEHSHQIGGVSLPFRTLPPVGRISALLRKVSTIGRLRAAFRTADCAGSVTAAQHITMHETSHTTLQADPVALRRAGTRIGMWSTLCVFVLAFHYIDQVPQIALHHKWCVSLVNLFIFANFVSSLAVMQSCDTHMTCPVT